MTKWGTAIQSRDEQHALKRAALIRAAGRAFGRDGFHNTSLDDIASELKVSKPALYYYVKNKHELLYECHMVALDLGDEAISQARRDGKTGLDRLTLFLRRYIELLTSELGASAVLSDHSALLPGDRERVRVRRARVDRVLRDMVADGIADGSIRPCDPKLAVFWFMGAVNGISRWFRPDGPESGASIAETFASLLIGSLAATRPPATRPGRSPVEPKASVSRRRS